MKQSNKKIKFWIYFSLIFLVYLFIFTEPLMARMETMSASKGVCPLCSYHPPGKGFTCHDCGKWALTVDAKIIRVKSEIFLVYGDHWHVYECPYCGAENTVYIGDLLELLTKGIEEISSSYKEIEAELDKPGASCFIATAAFGTPLAQEIEILREFRDVILLHNYVGKVLVDVYYKVSPPIAYFIARSEKRRSITRTILIPVVRIVEINLHCSMKKKRIRSFHQKQEIKPKDFKIKNQASKSLRDYK